MKLYGLRISPDNFFLRGLVLNFPTIYTFTYLRCLDCVHLFVFVLPIESNYEKRYQNIAQPQRKCLVLKRKFCISCPSALSILLHPKYTHAIWISRNSSQNLMRYSDFVNLAVWRRHYWSQPNRRKNKIAVSSRVLRVGLRNSNGMCIFWMEQDRQRAGTRNTNFPLQNQTFPLWLGNDLISFFIIWVYGEDKNK